MSIREALLEIAQKWPAYRLSRAINSKEHVDQIVAKALPDILSKVVADYPYLRHEGSSGRGNVSAAPWIASFNPRITSSAQDGYYPVYLFSTDLKRVYLTFALGATQFDRQFGTNNESIQRMRAAAAKIRALCDTTPKPERLCLAEIDLKSKNANRRYRCYEADVIYSFPAYSLDNLPPDSILEADFRGLIEFYELVANDPTIPDLEELVEAAIAVPPATTQKVLVREFHPRPPMEARRTIGQGRQSERRSKISKKVGNAGELVVLKAEREKLRSGGRPDLADKVCHLAAEGKTPGWDIASFEIDGTPIYIEVKSTRGKVISAVELTRNEWVAAQRPELAADYFIYLVVEVLSGAPKIEVLRNPAAYFNSGILSVEPSVFELSLREREMAS